MLKHRQQNQIRASYFQLMEQHLHIEVWDYNRLWFNSFVGYESIELMAIADGTTRQTVNIYDKIDKAGEGALKCTLSFKIVFEEIWDFYLQFLDWRITNLEDQNSKKSINPQLSLKIKSRNSLV